MIGIVEVVILIASVGVIVALVVHGVRGFVRSLRAGLRGEESAGVPLRTMLFRTVLVTLLVLVLLIGAVIDHQERENDWPMSEALPELSTLRARRAAWLDQKAYDAIRAALLDLDGIGTSVSGSLDLKHPDSEDGLPLAAIVKVRDQGWAVGEGDVLGEPVRYVAWRTSPRQGTYYSYEPAAWYVSLLGYLWQLGSTALLLSPFAAVAAWYLNRRIAKPVEQVAAASVVLAGGGTPMPVPTKAPAELSTLAKSFNHMAEKLRKAQDSEREFLMSVGHELKTPLTAIDGYAELLQDEAVEPRKAAAVLSVESSRLRRLITDLLELARIGRSEFTVVDEPVDLAETAREAVARFETLAGTLGVALKADAPEPAPARGDAGRLLQVASNLVENALRITRSGDRLDVVARPGMLSVRDTGPGLAAEDVVHAFERFYLHRKYAEGSEVGTGLGLAIVKDLVQAMGGYVEVESTAGLGSSFSVHLPTAHGESSVAADGAETGA